MSPFEACVRGLLRSHKLFEQGIGDGVEHDQLWEGLEKPWYKLSPEDQEDLGLLSEALYALADEKRLKEVTP